MNWKEYCKLKEPIMEGIRGYKKRLNELDKQYIDEHARFERGTHVIIRTKRAIRHAVVVGYDINDNGKCVPRLLLMMNSVYGHKRFFHLHETDDSIVIEKYDDDEQQ